MRLGTHCERNPRSFKAGFFIYVEEVYPAVLARKVKEAGSPYHRVIKAGVSGLATDPTEKNLAAIVERLSLAEDRTSAEEIGGPLFRRQ